MIALILAAAASAQAPPGAPVLNNPMGARGIASCSLWKADPVRRTMPAPRARRLIDLPPANLEIPVLRLGADGCSQPVIVRYSVEGDGHYAAGSPGGGK